MTKLTQATRVVNTGHISGKFFSHDVLLVERDGVELGFIFRFCSSWDAHLPNNPNNERSFRTRKEAVAYLENREA